MVGENDDVLRDVFDGSLFRNNPILSADPNALAILVYSDGVNFVDTASSRPVKLTMFYFILLNLLNAYRSRVSSINLLCAVETSLVNSYGLNEFLKPIVEDVKKLQQGVELPDGKNIKETALAFSGDNLASNEMGNFKCGFTAFKCCRRCNSTHNQIQCTVVDDVSLWRTPDQYNEQVEK